MYLTKMPDPTKNEYKTYIKIKDSTIRVIQEKEIIREKSKVNITNIFNTSANEETHYTNSDSNRLIFIDSFLRSKGYR
jgi:hypothetical protein